MPNKHKSLQNLHYGTYLTTHYQILPNISCSNISGGLLELFDRRKILVPTLLNCIATQFSYNIQKGLDCGPLHA